MTAINITAAPGTDIWRKPPHTDLFDAPTVPPASPTPASAPLPSFVSARVSFSLVWSVQYDQAGLLLSLRKKGDSASAPPAKWIKTGVEFYNSAPRISTVACDAWADWSVAPIAAKPGDWITVSIERAGDHHGASLWVYQLLEDGTKEPLREICWVYPPGSEAEWEIRVDAFAARPGKDVAEGLEAQIKDFVVKWE